MIRVIRGFIISLVISTTLTSQTIRTEDIPVIEEPIVEQTVEVEEYVEHVEYDKPIAKDVLPVLTKNVIKNEDEPETETEDGYLGVSQEEIELIALVTMAEAEGESEYGKRLVIDTILNRVDSELRYFPDTITEVIYQPRQFSSMWGDRVNRCYVREDICQLVREELESRTNYDVLYFHADHYGKYGTPMFSEGNHYFSSY